MTEIEKFRASNLEIKATLEALGAIAVNSHDAVERAAAVHGLIDTIRSLLAGHEALGAMASRSMSEAVAITREISATVVESHGEGKSRAELAALIRGQ